MKSLYIRDSERGNENLSLDKMLMACTSVQVNAVCRKLESIEYTVLFSQIDNEDCLPKFICPACFVQLKNAYCFKKQCEKTDEFLRYYLRNLNIEVNIKEEPAIDLEFISDPIGYNNPALSEEICKKNVIDDIKADPEILSEKTLKVNNSWTQNIACLTYNRYYYYYSEN